MKTKLPAIDVARASLDAQQTAYASKRGGKALAELVVDTFVMAETMIGDLSNEDIALVLSAFQVDMASGSTSSYTPFISASFGEVDPDANYIKDLNGTPRPKWVRDKNMAPYFHTMEAVHEKGFNARSDRQEMISFIVNGGGSQTIANKRKAARSQAAKPEKEATAERLRETYLTHGTQALVTLEGASIQVGKDAHKFITVVLERDGDRWLFRGVASEKGDGALDKLAKDANASIVERLAREREQQKAIDFATEKARREGREEALAELKAGQA